MMTKAELEAEITRLRIRVAELEGAVAAYQYALSQNPPQPLTTADTWQWWQPQVFNTPNTFTIPCTTS